MREGVTLLTAAEYKKMIEKNRVSTERKFPYLLKNL